MPRRSPFAEISLWGALGAALAIGAAPGPAAAQPVDRSFATEPTEGVRLPLTPLAGEHDALATVVNPAGLWFLRGGSFAMALDLGDDDEATEPGSGFGFYAGSTLGGGLLPAIGWGVGVEILDPPRAQLAPDPGTPLRLTLGTALGLGRSSAIGFAWHRFFDDERAALDGRSTYTLGLSSRFGPRWAAGLVVRDLFAPEIAQVPVQRRYELEVVSRPTATDWLELGVGGRVGEIRADVDGWLRASWRVVQGMYLRGEVGTYAVNVIERSASGDVDTYDERELRATLGIELSFGGLGAAAYGTGSLLDDDARLSSGTLVVRAGAVAVPSVLPAQRRIERIELSGSIDERRLTSLVLQLRALERDEAVVAVFLRLNGTSGGWATTEDLRSELLRLRARGKKVFAFLVEANTRDYFLATAADQIYLDPAGGIRLVGLAGSSIYFKGLFDKLGVRALFERIEEYKSAPEAYTRSGPTEPALRMREELYDSLYAQLVARIAEARGLDAKAVAALIDGGPYTAGDLQGDTRLVDGIATPEEVSELVTKALGATYPVGSAPQVRPESWDFPEIAIIYIEGDIIEGKSQTIPLIGRRLVGSETISEAIRTARQSDRVKAIILRINSPGGSALASELMAREVFKTREEKPIICSMGDIAASGGYFAAAGCKTILAMPMTITGSIGIFYGKFDVSGLAEKLGLSWYTSTRGRRADLDSYFRGYTEEERAMIRDKIRYFYGRFTQTVADGRGLTQERVDEVGRGRVWTGTQALPLRLVDRHGGLGEAIELAKREAGLGPDDRARVLLLPLAGTSLLDLILGLPGLPVGDEVRAERAAAGWLPGIGELLRALPGSLLHDPDAPQARLPYDIVWE